MLPDDDEPPASLGVDASMATAVASSAAAVRSLLVFMYILFDRVIECESGDVTLASLCQLSCSRLFPLRNLFFLLMMLGVVSMFVDMGASISKI